MVAAPSYVKTHCFLSDQNTMMKSNIKKSDENVIAVTSSLLRHRKTSPK